MKYLFLVVFILPGCSFIARTGYGAKKMNTENSKTIINWTENKGLLNNAYVFSVEPNNFMQYFIEHFESPMLYNSKGEFIMSGNCHLTFDDFIANLKKQDSNKVAKVTEESQKFDYVFGNLKTLFGNSIDTNLIKSNTNYILTLPFALALGNKVQVKDLKKYYAAAINNKNASIQVILINLDKQEWWGKEWNEKIKVDI